MLLLIRSITSTTCHEAWPEAKSVLRRALEMRREIQREGWLNLNGAGRRLRAAPAWRDWCARSIKNDTR